MKRKSDGTDEKEVSLIDERSLKEVAAQYKVQRVDVKGHLVHHVGEYVDIERYSRGSLGVIVSLGEKRVTVDEDCFILREEPTTLLDTPDDLVPTPED